MPRNYGYDAANRITSYNEPTTSKSQSYGYDAFGNLWQSGAATGVPELRPNGPSWYLMGDGTVKNRLAQTDYDNAGYQRQLSIAYGGTNAIYDGEGRLVQAAFGGVVATYDYDAEGRQVRRTDAGGVVTYYVYDAEGQLMAEYGGAATGSGTQYIATDHLGSTRMVQDAQGNCVARMDYAPYGATVSRSGQDCYGTAWTSGMLFAGARRDAATDLDQMGAREHWGTLGRFTSPDPYNDGANLTDPRSWNMYGYAGNNPLMYVDPDGHDYRVCITGQGCQDMTDEQWEEWRKKYKDRIVYFAPSGRIEDRETEKKIGSATWFDGDAVRRINNAIGLLHFFVATQTAEMAGGALGVGGTAILPRVIPPQIARNAFKGGMAERMIEATLRLKGYKIVGRHVTARTSKGVRYVDYIVERSGQYTAIEVKSGNAVRNAGQVAKDAAMEAEGAALGNNAGVLRGQTLKLKTVEMRFPF